MNVGWGVWGWCGVVGTEKLRPYNVARAPKRNQNQKRDRKEKSAAFDQKNFARRYFSPWLKLARHKFQKRQAFFEMRASHLIKKSFFAFKENVYNSSGEKQRVRNIVLLRATHLIRSAFYGGFVTYR